MFDKSKAFTRKILTYIGQKIKTMVDFFYPPFRRYMSKRLFRYAVIGVANLVFDWVLYFITFHFLLEKQMLHLGPITFSSHIASMLLVFPITFTSGFLLQKYVTFSASAIKGRVQIIRYLSVVLANLLINYLGLKLLVDFLFLFPTPSKMIVTFFTVIFSYMSQKKFTFRIKKS
jgi:putative flippase GtrA